MADKEKPTRIITPAAVVTMAYISAPSETYGNYTARCTFDPKNDEHRRFLSQLKKLHTAAIAAAQATFKPSKKQKALKVNPFYHENEDTPTVYCNFTEKAKISYKDKKTGEEKTIDLKPEIVDALGQKCNVEIWGGSTIKCAIDVSPYNRAISGEHTAGISLRLKGVQVIDLKTRGKRDLGFGAVEGGFDSNNFMPPTIENADDTSDDEFTLDDDFNSDDTGAAEETAAEPTAAANADDFDF